MSDEPFPQDGYPANEDAKQAQMTPAMESLLAQVDEAPAEGWQPEAGDKIVGVLTERTMSSEGEWGAYPILTLQHADGSRTAVHAFHTVLRNELDRRRPMVGDVVAIKYLGMSAGKGTDYEGYRVALQRNQANADKIARIEAERAVS